DTYSSWMITKAGAINVASEYSGYPKLSYEFIISSDPDIIIITVMSADIGRLKKELSNSPIVNTKAWRTGRVFVFLGDADNLISRPGPRVAMGVKLLARVIHPDIFGGDLPQNVVRLGD
ncbi:MAG: ABC transporter substrate-binding protein, partial [candidate division WOR-3 bacterium]